MSNLRQLFIGLALVAGLATRAPAADIVFYNGDYVFGKAQINSTSRSGSYQLVQGNTYGRQLARVYANNNSLAESYPSLTVDRTGPNFYIEMNTFANTGRIYSSAFAQEYTTQPTTNNGFQYIYFYVRPTYSGEYIGKPITLTVNAFASSNIIYPDSRANNFHAIYGPNGLMIQRRDYGTRTNRATQYVSTTMGTWNRVAIQAVSQSTIRTSAQLMAKITVTAR